MSQKAIDVLVRRFGHGKKHAARVCETLKPEEVAELEKQWTAAPVHKTLDDKPAPPPAEEPASE